MNSAQLLLLEQAQSALEAGNFTAAITDFTIVRDAYPTDASLGVLLANVYRLAGDVLGVRRALLHTYAHATWSDAATALSLGAALLEVGAATEAAACFTRVVALRPDDPAGLAALAGAMRTMGQPDAAWPFVHRALTIAPQHAAFLLTAAQVRHDLADLPGALQWLDRADAIRPQHAPTHVQRAYTTLLGGASSRGWAFFESRTLPTPQTSARSWNGEPLDGASVLVTAEQGVGDQFQFARFIPLLADRGAARVVVECHVDAVALFRSNGFDAVARGTAVSTDWHVPMLSLPHRLALDDAVLGARVPYFHAPHHDISSSHNARNDVPRIGLVWAGNPAFAGRLTRDLEVAQLPALLRDRRLHWISLQQGPAGDVAFPDLERSPAVADWSATATLLASLDGVVTTDTGVAHLAGAMGLRTWVLLQAVPDWRWGLHGTSTPWYPTVRLVRQATPGNWSSVVTAILADPEFTNGRRQ